MLGIEPDCLGSKVGFTEVDDGVGAVDAFKSEELR